MEEGREPRFWDERIGWGAIRRRLLDRPIPATVGWLHTLGSVTLALVLILVFTGVLLALNYSPSTEHAYHSAYYVETQVPLGSLVRAVHHWAASLLVVAVALHLLHAFFSFAYRRPREVTWCTGVLLLLLVLAMAFTGYLLPWDEKAYWATVVGTQFVAQLPFVGDFLLHAVRGGQEVGAATLARFYGAHIALLPALLGLVLLVHLYLVVYHGVSSKKEGGASVPFWPDVVAMDALAVVVTLAVLFTLALRVGAPLGSPADPTNTAFTPRPEWYFLPLFQLLTFFPGRAESFAALGLPFASAVLLFTLPWWGRFLLAARPGRVALRAAGVVALGGVIGLGVAGWLERPATPAGAPPEVARGRLLYEQLGCVNCHTIRGVGGVIGPDLTLVALRRPDPKWLAQHLTDPRSVVPSSPMPAFPLDEGRRHDLIAYLKSLGNDLRHSPAAAGLFAQRCMPCHSLGGQGGHVGPDLDRIARLRTASYVHQYIENPRSLNPQALMPPVTGLSHEQVEDIARYVVATGLASGERSPDALGVTPPGVNPAGRPPEAPSGSERRAR